MSKSITDIGERTKKSLFWQMFLPGTYQVVRFAASIIIARLLDPKDFGIVGIASALVYYANSLTNFGFSAALVQKKSISEKHNYSIFTINLLISAILTSLTFIFARNLAHFFNAPESKNVFRALSILFLVTTFDVIPLCLLKREVRYKTISVIDFLRGFCQTGISLFMAVIGFRYWALVFGLISGQLISTILINYQVKWIPKIRYYFDSVKEIFNFSGWNFLLGQSICLGLNLDTFIVGKFLGTVSLGFYDKAFSFADMPYQSITAKISDVMFASFSRSQVDTNILKGHFIKIVSIISITCFPIFLGLIVIAPYFVLVLLGEKWRAMIVPFQLLLLAAIFRSLTTILGSLNLGVGNYKAYTKRRLYGIFSLPIVLLIFVNKGIEIISLIMLIESIGTLILSFDVTKQCFHIGWQHFIQAIKPALSGAIIMFIVVKLLSYLILSEINIINLLILITVGIVVYGMWLLLIDFKETRFLKMELKDRMSKIKKVVITSV